MATIIIDNRSTIRAGFSSERAARIVRPAVVGYPKKIMGMGKGEILMGDDAMKKKSLLDMKYPVQGGTIHDIDSLQVLWESLFKDLAVSAEDYSILVTELPFTPPETREKMASILFETFHAPAIYLAPQPALSAHASSRPDSIVLDIHDTVTYCMPVVGGIPSQTNARKANFGSNIIKDFLRTSFMENTISDASMANLINQRCYVAADFEKELACPSRPAAAFELPDGSALEVGNEAFRGTELLFQPSLGPTSSFSSFDPPPGLPQLLRQTLSSLDNASLLSNIVLAGEATHLPGFTERLTQEVQTLFPSGKVFVDAPQPLLTRSISSWLGGALLASSEQFHRKMVYQQHYDEYGASIIHSAFQIQ